MRGKKYRFQPFEPRAICCLHCYVCHFKYKKPQMGLWLYPSMLENMKDWGRSEKVKTSPRSLLASLLLNIAPYIWLPLKNLDSRHMGYQEEVKSMDKVVAKPTPMSLDRSFGSAEICRFSPWSRSDAFNGNARCGELHRITPSIALLPSSLRIEKPPRPHDGI